MYCIFSPYNVITDDIAQWCSQFMLVLPLLCALVLKMDRSLVNTTSVSHTELSVEERFITGVVLILLSTSVVVITVLLAIAEAYKTRVKACIGRCSRQCQRISECFPETKRVDPAHHTTRTSMNAIQSRVVVPLKLARKMSVSKRNVAMLKRDAELDSAAREEIRRAERVRQRSKSAARLAIRVSKSSAGGEKTRHTITGPRDFKMYGAGSRNSDVV